MRNWLKKVRVIVRSIGRIAIFLLTEDALPAIGLSSLAEHIVTHHYSGLSWDPDHRDLALAKIYEKGGKIDRAEESYKRAIAIRSNEPDNRAI
jgi:hypothetical protein